MPPDAPSNSRLPQLAVWSGYGTAIGSCKQVPFMAADSKWRP